MPTWEIAFLGIFLGALSRMILPYLRKAKENPDIKFDFKYLVTFGIVVVMAFIASSLIFAGYSVPSNQTPEVFFLGFMTGWSSTDILNEIVATGEH